MSKSRKTVKIVESIITVSIIITLLYSSIYSVFIKRQDIKSELEKRTFETNETLSSNSFMSSEFINGFESLLADQFYNRFELIKAKSTLNYSFGDFIYQYTDNPLVLNRIGDSDIYQIGTSDYITAFPFIYNQTYADRLINRAQQINALAADYPDINMFVYKPTQITETSFFDDANNIIGAGPEYDQILRDNLKVPYASFKFNSFEDYPRYQYFTDHHWTHRGMYEGYKQIIQMMLGDDEPLLEPIAEDCKDGIKFYGTYSSLSGFVTDGAPFCVYEYDLPKYTFYGLDDVVIENPNDTNKFFNTTITDPNRYFYSDAYNNYQPFITIKSDAQRDESLLIIGDSYAPAILPLLAQHFSTIYYLDPVSYKWGYWRFFYYDSFLKDKHIDNVLFMYVIDNYFSEDEYGAVYENFDITRD